MHAIWPALVGMSQLPMLATAAPTSSIPPMQITKTKVHQVDGGNTTIKFHVYDPDPLTLSSARCTGSWVSGSTGYPQGSYSTCGNTSFAWNMASYTDVNAFVLGIEHTFEDPAVGQFPYDQVTNFAHATVGEPDIWCSVLSGQGSCQQYANNTISAPVYATIAKKR